ncbi:MAG: hypothetical protein DDG60_09705 [Anaerolineae bacterium]|nr:MAG: hypothetical protein DDG60_09705 [Anaerolineae bacterium]
MDSFIGFYQSPSQLPLSEPLSQLSQLPLSEEPLSQLLPLELLQSLLELLEEYPLLSSEASQSWS